MDNQEALKLIAELTEQTNKTLASHRESLETISREVVDTRNRVIDLWKRVFGEVPGEAPKSIN